MTAIFVCHSAEDALCAEQICQGLEAKGYITWREPTSLSRTVSPSPAARKY